MSYVEKNIKNYIESKGIKKSHIYREINMSKGTFYSKVNGKSDFTAEEIALVCEVIGADPNDILKRKEPCLA